MQIDTNTWKPFRVGDLFDVSLAKGDIQANFVSDGDVPLVSAGNVDNGISAMISDAGDGVSEIFDAGCVTVSMFGTAFWQSERFYAVSHGRVNVLRPLQDVTDIVGLFLSATLNVRLAGLYGYSTMCTRTRLVDETVLLPATHDGEPDWAYMEAYMQQVLDREEMFAEHLASLTAEAVADGHVVDTSAWKAFKVGDLFGIAKHGTYVNPRYLSSDADGFAIVSASTKNNGVSDDRYACDESLLIPSGVVTWGKQSPLFAYQTEVTIPGQGVYYYDVTALSKYQALFVCSVMQSAVASKYDYQECLIGSKMDGEFVLLPATPDGAPDWAYMERYMRDVMAAEALFADELDRLSRE